MDNNGKWTCSTHSEHFNDGEYFETKEQAIEFGKAEYSQYRTVSKFYVGQVESVGLGVCVDTESILEHINQSVSDEVGEAAEDYLLDTKQEHDDELENELCEVIANWIERHGYGPTFFRVVNIEKVEVA